MLSQVQQSLTFKILPPSYPALASVIAPSIGYPTAEKIQSVLNGYNNRGTWFVGSLNLITCKGHGNKILLIAHSMDTFKPQGKKICSPLKIQIE